MEAETPYQMIYRIYYFYELFSKLIYRAMKNVASDRMEEAVTFFDETGSEAKAQTKTLVLSKADDGLVKGGSTKELKDTFLIGVKATGKFLDIGIVESQEKKERVINGQKSTTSNNNAY